ncbi:MAG TPA: M28 family peptidase [Anaerolineales bacterium]|nr:M28 family peptidase [Anaerolineales bacterium]
MAENITVNDAQYALDIVKKICAEVGPGLPGTPQEQERAKMIKKELESHLGAENVAVEEFTLAPDACLSPFPGVLIMILAVLLNISTGRLSGVWPWLTSIAALVFSILAPSLFILEFILSYELIDPLFPKKVSLNVIGRLRKPGTQNVKRLLILSGHHDSAPENTWLRFLGYGFFFLSTTYLIGLITMLVMNIIQLAGVIMGHAEIVRMGTLGWVLLVYPIVPSIIFAAFLTRGKVNGGTVPGAVDNLSACALTVAMCRFLVENLAHIPADTEIRFITFGSEEVGLRGSRRYVERHLNELKRLDAQVLNYEMVAHPEIVILTSEVHGTVKNSPEMVKSVVAAAQRAGVPYRVRPAFLGTAGDAGPFSRAGLKATTLLPFKFPQQMVACYHQRCDTPEVLALEPLLNVLKLTFEWVRCGGEGE